MLKADGAPYTVFTPFSRAWLAQPLPDAAELRPAPAVLPHPGDLAGESIPDTPTLPAGVPFPPGEAEWQRRLGDFLGDPIAAYGDRRDRVDIDGTSGLSPYLR